MKTAQKSQHWKYKNAHDWSEDQITDLIMEEVGKDVVRPVLSLLLVKLCEKAEVTKGGIILPNTEQDVFFSRVGRVLDMGEYCYDDVRFPKGPPCHIGDYITFEQYNFERAPIHSVFLYYIPCNRVTGIVPDPSEVLLGGR